MNGYSIRKFTVEDISQFIKLQAQWYSQEIAYGFVPCTEEFLTSRLSDYFYVAEINNKIIGFAYGMAHAKDIRIVSDYIVIEDIYISPGHRNLGVGNMLFVKILEIAHINGIDRSFLYSVDDPYKMLNIYEKHGFSLWMF